MNESKHDNRYMEFRLGDQLYALPLLNVKEVIQKPEVTPVPNMPSHFEGMMNLRGQILGVFSVRKKLSAKSRNASDPNSEVVVVIEQEGVNVGMIVDEVTKVLHPNQDMIRPAPLKEDDPSRLFINAVIQIDSDLVLCVDVFQLLELQKYSQLKKVS